jgi:hypothetical protein
MRSLVGGFRGASIPEAVICDAQIEPVDGLLWLIGRRIREPADGFQIAVCLESGVTPLAFFVTRLPREVDPRAPKS